MGLDEKIKVARFSVISNALLTGGKLAVGLAMNSVGVISEAMHSGLDLMAALIAYASVRQSACPADEEHAYGHGKFENVSAIIEALLIIAAGVMIVWQSVPKLLGARVVHHLGLGMVVMGASAATNLVISGLLMRTARRTGSPALEADAWHLRTDVYTSVGVFVAMVAIQLTGWYILDPIIALVVSLFIFKAAYDLLRDSWGSLVDARLSDEEEDLIRRVLADYAGEFVQFHNLRTRRAGPDRHIDLHLVVPGYRPIAQVHQLCDAIEDDIRRQLAGANVLIHTEPCRPGSDDCRVCRVHISHTPSGERNCEDCRACALDNGEAVPDAGEGG
ncbi:cation diffusion facilitator family transporter [Desulfofundulus sp.]|uniref:cation diffusion facilitator family transporter n=1 Tax=Desulfofundulus sp. TaxID=2282750 RepID=UPI003C76CF6F